MSRALPRDRAFLVQYSRDADPQAGRFCGRIEHVESGRSQRFGSHREFEKFLTALLSEQRDDNNPEMTP